MVEMAFRGFQITQDPFSGLIESACQGSKDWVQKPHFRGGLKGYLVEAWNAVGTLGKTQGLRSQG